MNKLNSAKIKNFCSSQNTVKKWKLKIFYHWRVENICNTYLVKDMYPEYINNCCSFKNKVNKKMYKIFEQMLYQVKDMDAWHHQSLENYKLTPQWDTTVHQLQWDKKKNDSAERRPGALLVGNKTVDTFWKTFRQYIYFLN